MPDLFTRAERSAIMARVKSENTSPERAVRQLLRGRGITIRSHCQELPGRPDFVIPQSRAAILVHGCFWHQHSCSRGSRQPSSNVDYWRQKLARNVLRDKATTRKLRRLGWRVLTIWECQIGRATLAARVAKFVARVRSNKS